MADIVRAGAWRAIRDVILELGGSPERIFSAAGISESELRNPEHYLQIELLVRTLEVAADVLNCPQFGLLSERSGSSPSIIGAMMLAASNASTCREGIGVVQRHIKLHNPTLDVTVTPGPLEGLERVYFSTTCERAANSKLYAERVLGSTHILLQRTYAQDYGPFAVYVPHAPLAPLEVYEKHFGCMPQFEQPVSGIVIESEKLDTPGDGRNAPLHSIAEQYLINLTNQTEDTMVARVKEITRDFISSDTFSANFVADTLNIHPRTLQRRLHESGVSFEQLKDDVRKEMAHEMLQQSDVPITHIAFVLGYADTSTFSRRARSWFNMSASDYRKHLTGSG